MAYDVRFRPAALRNLKSLPAEAHRRIIREIEALADNPRPAGIVKLSGEGEDFYRLRVGDYRVIYKIDDKVLLVLVVKLGHRREIYR